MNKIKILEKSKFTNRIHYEMERSERTNNPFSLIQLDLTKINERTNGQQFNKIIQIITPSFRTIDQAGWIKHNTICILLPETKTTGAKAAAAKFKNKLIENLGKDTSLLDFVVSTHPKPNDYKENKTSLNKTENRPSSQLSIYEMQYSSSPLMAEVISIDSSWILDLGKIDLINDWQFVMKRLIDIAGAVFGLLLFSPLMLIIAAAIKFTSKGPVFFPSRENGL